MAADRSMAPLYGLVLAGGTSSRMHSDKALIAYQGRPQLLRAFELLESVCERAYVSVRRDQTDETLRASLPQIVDGSVGEGPIAGIAAAQHFAPDAAWLVLACDLPYLTADTLRDLIARRDPAAIATAYRSASDGLPEPLCAIWEPASRERVLDWIAAGKSCPRKFLIVSNVPLLSLPRTEALDNVNTPAESTVALSRLS